MEQLIAIPYNKLKENAQNYAVMLSRDVHENTFAAIAREFTLPRAKARQTYSKMKLKQLRLYAWHLAIVHGHENTNAFLINAIYACYWDFGYTAAYFEKEYADILTEYRSGEPGMPARFIAALPPLITTVPAQTLERLIQMREVEKKPYPAMGRELLLSGTRTKREYEIYYHKKTMTLLHLIEEKTGETVGGDYLKLRCGTKKQYEMLCHDYPELTDGSI